MGRLLSRVVYALVLTAALAPAASAGPNTECPQFPPDYSVDLWSPILLGDRVYRVGLGYVPGDAGASAPVGSDPSARLQLFLYANPMSAATREPVSGSAVPGLVVGWTLGRTGETVPVASGTMGLAWTPRGPAYAAEIPIATTGGAGEFALDLDVQDPAAEASPDHDGGHGECPGVPADLDIETLFDLQEALREAADAAQSGSAVGNTFRVRLLSSLDIRPADNYSNIWGWDDGTTYLAIVGSTSGTAFIDVTDPGAPVEVGFVTGPSSSWREIKTYRDYAYIVTEGSGTGEGLQIVSLQNPLQPVLVNTYTATMRTSHTLYIDESNGRLYLNGTDAGLRILSLEPDPANPFEIGSWNVRYVHDSYGKGSFMCFAEINNGLQEIYDATDPQNLVLRGSWTTPGAFTHNCWSNPAETLLVTTDENNPGGALTVYDITNLSTSSPPPMLARFRRNPNSTVHNAYFEDGDPERVAMSHYGLGMRLIDLHRPTVPVELGGYDTYPSGDSGYNGAWGMYNYDPRGYFYVSDIQTGLYVLAYEPTGGTLSGVVRDAATSQPIGNARVVVLADGSLATSDVQGIYATYAPAGEVALRVSAAGYASRIVTAGTMPLDGRIDADVALVPLPRVGLSGTVRRSDTSAAIAGAEVRVAGTTLVATSAADGSYAFPEVAVGQQAITAAKFGFAPAEARIVLEEAAAGILDLALEPGLLVDDAETNKGWGLGVAGDTATSGIWTRVDPNGTGGGAVQPENDNTPAPGVTAFVTGQSSPGSGVEVGDVDGGPTTLLSPVFDAAGLGAARIGYHRWVSNNAGFFSGGRLLVQVSADNGGSWATLESQTGNANAWTRRELDLGTFGALTSQMRVRFRAEPATPYSYTVLEAGVDDFEVVRGCRTRFNAEAGDSDADGVVNACDACAADMGNDLDGDGLCGDADNAPFDANAGQEDADADGVGDAGDNCAALANADQRDLDLDRLGDACDADLDGDGLDDVLDSDRDGDGVADASDSCATVPNSAQLDRDADGAGDACDTDDGEVQGVRFAADTRLDWEREDGATAYHLYRGDLGADALVRLASCRVGSLATAYAVDEDQPIPGDGYFYLVTRLAGTIEGPLGRRSDGTERTIDAHCP